MNFDTDKFMAVIFTIALLPIAILMWVNVLKELHKEWKDWRK